jgi:hypothetical protein
MKVALGMPKKYSQGALKSTLSASFLAFKTISKPTRANVISDFIFAVFSAD